jgi:hypothetical protein
LPRLLQQPQPQPRRPPQARETQTEDADFPANKPFLAPDPEGPGRRAPSRHARLRQAASAGGAPAGGLGGESSAGTPRVSPPGAAGVPARSAGAPGLSPGGGRAGAEGGAGAGAGMQERRAAALHLVTQLPGLSLPQIAVALSRKLPAIAGFDAVQARPRPSTNRTRTPPLPSTNQTPTARCQCLAPLPLSLAAPPPHCASTRPTPGAPAAARARAPAARRLTAARRAQVLVVDVESDGGDLLVYTDALLPPRTNWTRLVPSPVLTGHVTGRVAPRPRTPTPPRAPTGVGCNGCRKGT